MGEIGAMVSQLQGEGFDLEALVDEELRLAGFLGRFDRTTKALNDRADAIAGEHTALKTLLDSIESQLKHLQHDHSCSFRDINELSENRTTHVLQKEQQPQEKTVIVIDDDDDGDDTDNTSTTSSNSLSTPGNQAFTSRGQAASTSTTHTSGSQIPSPGSSSALRKQGSKPFQNQPPHSASKDCSPFAVTQSSQRISPKQDSPPSLSSSQQTGHGRTATFRTIYPKLSSATPVSPSAANPSPAPSQAAFKSPPLPLSPRSMSGTQAERPWLTTTSTAQTTASTPVHSASGYISSPDSGGAPVSSMASRATLSPSQPSDAALQTGGPAVWSTAAPSTSRPRMSTAAQERIVGPGADVALPPPPSAAAASDTTVVQMGPPNFDVGIRVIAKRLDDLWYSGLIEKLVPDKYGKVRYKVKFDKGSRGVVSSNHIALETNPLASMLNVGSRVVGVYGKLDVLYAGIVAEKACNENKNRFLIFFDDGFAQYLSVRKLHHVYHTGKKVWDDVARHSQEFIQEYLEEFPSRPMLKVKAGQWVKTEWRGQWLKAKVMQLDCSLIKMLFQIDNRSEWIYRGSTRLEPLYSAIDGKISTAKKSKRSRKMNRASMSKSNEPFIDYSITKPCFGVCLYSKTDPRGEQQRQMEAKRQQTLNQQRQERSTTAAPPPPPISVPAANLPSGRDTDWTGGPSGGGGTGRSTREAPRSEPPAPSSSGAHSESGGAGRSSGVAPTDGGTRLGVTQPAPQASAPRAVKPISLGTSQADNSGVKYKPTQNGASVKPVCELSTLPGKPYELPQPNPPRGESLQVPVEGGAVSSSEEGPGTRGDSTQSFGRVHYTADSSAAAIKASHMRKRTSAGLFSAQSGGVEVIDLEADVQATEEPILHKEMLYEHRALAEDFYDSWEAPWLRKNRRDIRSTGTNRAPAIRFPSNNKRKQDMASLIEARLRNGEATRPEEEPELPLFQSKTVRRGPHKCGPGCVQVDAMTQQGFSRHNTLAVPFLCDWRREVVMKNPGSRKDVYYRAPCNRRLRSLGDVARYLTITKSTHVTIDQFCFDARVSCHDAPDRGPKDIIPDISDGKEPIAIPVINLLDSNFPPPIDYITHRIWKERLDVVLDPGFLACCDCTDDCQDKSKCSCAQLTISASATIDGKEDKNCGYEYRRLKDCVTTGIYECNQNCSCSSRCFNRVVQNGLRCRLQVFKTVNRGWGLRAVDDIPAGTFVCTYTGMILSEEMANKEGKDFGDEYFAELDHIEIVEKAKEGYESNVSELEEDDSVILERLDCLTSPSDSGCDRSCSSESDSSDAESLVSVGSSLSNRSGSRAGDVISSAKAHRRRKRKKLSRKSSKKMKGIVGQEILAVERESRVQSLSHIADEKWCVLALKRNHDDPKAAAAFLENMKKGTANDQTPEDVADSVGEGWTRHWNSGSTSELDQRSKAITDEENTTQSSDFDFDDIDAEAVENHLKSRAVENSATTDQAATVATEPLGVSPEDSEPKDEQTAASRADLAKVDSKGSLDEGNQAERAAPSSSALETQDQAADSPDSAPSLLSAVDLSRLAAQNPKLDDGPPILVKMNPRRQANTLEDMITRLKNRVQVEGSVSKERHEEQGHSVDSESTVPGGLPTSGQTGDRFAHVRSDAPLSGVPEGSRTQIVGEIGSGVAMEAQSGSIGETLVSPEEFPVGEPVLDEVSTATSNDKPSSDVSASGLAEGRFGEKSPSARVELASDFSSDVAELDASFPPSPASWRSDLSRSESIDRKSEVSTDDSRARAHRVKPAGGDSRGHKVKIRRATKPASNASPHTPEMCLSRQSSVSSRRVSTRSHFGDEPCYVIDAKQYGNCGRYLNHSCSPNLFVQNVFVDTHDLRFPWVAFFAQHNISSGSELTWDYMYEVGSVQDKVLHCYCGSAECRGRLL